MGENVNAKLLRKSSPAQYINSKNIIEETGKYFLQWGNRVLISTGCKAWDSIKDKLTYSLNKYGIIWDKNIFIGESSNRNISLIKDKIKEIEANVMVAVGGGKSIDAAKVAAEECNLPIVCIPTIAATCAAVTAVSVIYSDDGIYERDIFLRTNPNLVLIDPMIIKQAPDIYMKAGILDAISKWFEGKAAVKNIINMDLFNQTALLIAKQLYENMSINAQRAMELTRSNEFNEVLNEVIDLNIYFAGMIQSLGPELARGGMAHAISNGLTVIEKSHELLHGIKVGYGIMIQLILENKNIKEIQKTLSFYKKINFKPSLRNLNIEVNKDTINKIAEKTLIDPLMKISFSNIKKAMIIEAIEKLEELAE